jgi:GntR family transcriptional regulator
MPADYLRIAAEITQKIRSGEWPPGMTLPTKRKLAETYGTSTGTVDAAMIHLRTLKLVSGHQGKAVYVAKDIPPAETPPTSPS